MNTPSIVGLVFLAMIAIVIIWEGITHIMNVVSYRETSLYQSCQPPEVKYSDTQYCLHVLKQSTLTDSKVVLEIRGKQENGFTYSRAYPDQTPSEVDTRNTQTQWDDNGVTLTVNYGGTSGERLYIPPTLFVGSRLAR